MINVNGGCRLLRATSERGPNPHVPGDVGAGSTWAGSQELPGHVITSDRGLRKRRLTWDSGRGREAQVSEKSLDTIHHVRYRQLGGVQFDGIVCRFERSHRALHVARIPSLNLFQKTR